jgi:hypothetical protein
MRSPAPPNDPAFPVAAATRSVVPPTDPEHRDLTDVLLLGESG